MEYLQDKGGVGGDQTGEATRRSLSQRGPAHGYRRCRFNECIGIEDCCRLRIGPGLGRTGHRNRSHF
jgi:hypothetical protein